MSTITHTFNFTDTAGTVQNFEAEGTLRLNSRYLYVSAYRPTIEALIEQFPNLIEVQAGEKQDYHTLKSIIAVCASGSYEIRACERDGAFVQLPTVCVNVKRFLGAQGRSAKLRERVNQGSIIRVKAGTRFGDRTLPLSKRPFYRYDHTEIITEDLLIYVTREDKGKVINAQGGLESEVISLRSHLGIDCPAGWGIVQDIKGLEIVHKGGLTISHSPGACL